MLGRALPLQFAQVGFIRSKDEIELCKIRFAHLARPKVLERLTARGGVPNGPGIGRTTDVIVGCPRRINRQRKSGARRLRTQHRLRRGRSTYISQTNN